MILIGIYCHQENVQIHCQKLTVQCTHWTPPFLKKEVYICILRWKVGIDEVSGTNTIGDRIWSNYNSLKKCVFSPVVMYYMYLHSKQMV